MSPIRTLFLSLASVAFLVASDNSLAHTDEVLATQKAPNGGELRVAGPYHLELVVATDSREVRENPIVLHVSDHDGVAIPTAGARATATLLAGKIKATVTLAADGGNRLKGFAKYASTPDMKVVVTLTLPGQPAEQARFTPLATSR